MMYYMSSATFILLCICPLFCHKLECTAKQYEWPVDKPKYCCNKCPPGKYMEDRNPETCSNVCKDCTGDRYTDSYNVGACKVCNNCNKVNMDYMSPCNNTHNAVCRCNTGYRCAGETCTYCIQATSTMMTPTTTTLPPSTTDTAWFMVIIILICLGIALIIIAKIKPVLKWFTHKKGYCLATKPSVPASVYIEEEDVCKPVQEMCGKCDQLIDIINQNHDK